MLAIQKKWSEAFIQQVQTDLEAYEALAKMPLPICHRLHYLQMWLEKLCKAHMWNEAGITREALFSHNVVGKILPQLVRHHWRDIGFQSKPDFTQIRELCIEVDRLHPQIDDDGKRPDNVEYPWAAARNGQPVIVAPRNESFLGPTTFNIRGQLRETGSLLLSLLEMSPFALQTDFTITSAKG